eukprot:TRINITY_DN15476_c0_g2_i1.p1 TRINITY_DN15476_c0_g2~~TRINITY_DN15476_c0_g2_i1.p1  ORF type:complete len:212 (-),score=40.57 TRINITY_DN15476_c0_g2_i1:40-675(-)
MSPEQTELVELKRKLILEHAAFAAQQAEETTQEDPPDVKRPDRLMNVQYTSSDFLHKKDPLRTVLWDVMQTRAEVAERIAATKTPASKRLDIERALLLSPTRYGSKACTVPTAAVPTESRAEEGVNPYQLSESELTRLSKESELYQQRPGPGFEAESELPDGVTDPYQLSESELVRLNKESEPVSYTHLTLPTKRIVEILVVGGSLKKKHT